MTRRGERPTFKQSRYARKLPLLRLACSLGGFVILAFWAWDYLMDPAAAFATGLARLVMTTVLLMMAILARRKVAEDGHRYLLLYNLGITTVAMGLAGILGYIDGGLPYLLPSFLVLLLVVVLIAPAWTAVLTAFPLLLLFANAAAIIGDGTLLQIASLNGFLLAAMVICAQLLRTQEGFEAEVFKLQDALATERERLHYFATTDTLTGVLNRREFLARTDQECARQLRGDQPAALLMLDIDFFKQINDRYGHSTGDKVLRELAGLWTSELRQIDILGRIGGEEFAILLPHTPLPRAMEVAQRLRKATEAAMITANDTEGRVPITISVGCASLGSGLTNAALRRADKALYRAKEAGRNQVQTEDSQTLPGQPSHTATG